jgi:hypothetical protein
MNDEHAASVPYPAAEAGEVHNGTVPEHLASSRHGAGTVSLTEFSLTREQVVELYAAAGINVRPRTVSRYAQEGRLHARKVEAERGLERYLFDRRSVESDVEKRLQGPGPVYAPAEDGAGEDDDATVPEELASSLHGAGTVPKRQAASRLPERVRELELENAALRARVREKIERHQEDTATIQELRNENGQLRIGYGKAEGRALALEERLRLLEAPKPDPSPPDSAEAMPAAATEPAATAETPRRPWWRIFGAR